MMNEKLKTLILLFWKGMLSKEARRELLSELEDNEEGLRMGMENEFGKIQSDEQLHRDEDYQLYLQKILERAGCDDITAERVRPMWYKWAVAASVVLISGIGYLAWTGTTINGDFSAPSSQQQVSQNTTVICSDPGRARTFTLKDGSEVTLFPGGSLTYDARYGEDHRRLSLIGKATFMVTHDTVRPFVVEANGYTTTALGTSFVVDAQSTDQVKVRLLTGKVVVRSTPKTRYAISDQYLFPGEELAIEAGRSALEKRSFTKEIPSAKRIAPRRPSIQKNPSRPNLHFVETPLPEVLKKISASKKIQFYFDDVEIRDRYFTGDFSEEDDLEAILDIICMINGLEYEKQGDNAVKFRHAAGNGKPE